MRALTCIGMNARVKPPYDPAKDEDYWGLRRALACVSGARGDEILTRYDEWRAVPRPGATRVWVGPARSYKRSRKNDERKALASRFKPTARSDVYYRRLPWIKDEFGRRLAACAGSAAASPNFRPACCCGAGRAMRRRSIGQ